MGKFRIGFRLLAALTLLAGLANVGLADPTPAQLLGYSPAQKVEVNVPAAAEAGKCVVELEKGKPTADGKQPTAWVVKDASGKVLRKFHDTTGAGGVNIIAYFRDGEEVYRELVTNNKINQYRWVGAEGSKWGVDLNGDNKIDTWTVISPEEVSQEVLAAVLTKDQKRFEALLITQADMDALGLGGPEAERIKAKLKAAAATFQKTCNDLAALKPATQWIHLDAKHPQTTPADAIDAKADLVRYRQAALLYQDGNGQAAKHEWIHVGDLVQVGKAWRLIQAPTPGIQAPAEPDDKGTTTGFPIPPGAEKLIQELQELDKAGPGKAKDGVTVFNMKRAAILEKVAALYTEAKDRDKRDVWLKQVADCYATAAQGGDKAALERLGQYAEAYAKEPKSTIHPYFLFRHLTSEYAVALPDIGRNQDKLNKYQEAWKEKLTRFITAHAKADDTPDAMMQLGLVNEYFGPKTEGEAKAAYDLLVKNFPAHPLAKRAQGCLDRLNLEGNAINLAAPTVGGGPAFNIQAHLGKAVIVYYWASWNDLALSDLSKIELAMKAFPGKVELVGVNLDMVQADAVAFVNKNNVKGTHLWMPNGLESPLAVQYGIGSLPVMFLVGPDGKVITRTAQAATVDEELKKVFKGDEKKDK
jgi:thiol-disulfide isomerase/thioredoxin